MSAQVWSGGPTLRGFLLAGIAEDEDVAQQGDGGILDSEDAWFSKIRILAECEAKRRIVAEAAEHETCGGGYDECSEAALLTLRLLATVYADHPGYRQEWKP